MDPATFLGIATIVAIVAGPIIALHTQRKLDLAREKRDRKLQVFRELMATRGTKLSYRHVEALNAIQVEFLQGRKDRRVVDAWKIYLDHLNTPQPQPRPGDDPWLNRADELLTDLLYEMSQCMGYDFDKVTIKRGVYVPMGHGEIEVEQTVIRKALAEILTGRKALPVTAMPPLPAAEPTNRPAIASGQLPPRTDEQR